MISYKRSNKIGSTTCFLAIILAALILVESTYLIKVIEIERCATINRALKQQVEQVLASYDRELFENYGIYAFAQTELNESIFNNALSANGIDYNGSLYVGDVEVLEVTALKASIANFYSRRGGAIAVDYFANAINQALEQLDATGMIEGLRSYTSSPISGQISNILLGSVNSGASIIETISSLGIDSADERVSNLTTLISSLGSLNTSQTTEYMNLDVSDASGFISVIDNIDSLYSISSDVLSSTAFHAVGYHYASYNFDCFLPQTDDDGNALDCCIQGNCFNQIHDENTYDTEYILTGFEGIPALVTCGGFVFAIIQISNIIEILLDSTKMEVITGIAEVLEAAVIALTGGTVPIPSELYVFVIVYFSALINSVPDMIDVYSAEKIALLDFLPVPSTVSEAITFGYRDILSMYMFLIPDNTILERMLIVLKRDYGDMCVSCEYEFLWMEHSYSYNDCYQMYEGA